MSAATVISIFASSLGLRKDSISAKSRFFQLGGNSANAVATWLGLRKAGFTLKLQDLLSGNLSAEEICAQENDNTLGREHDGGFKIVPLLGQTLWSKEHIIEFTLTEFLKNPVASESTLETREEFLATGKLGFDLTYESLLSGDLSFALQDDKTGQLVGLAILSPAVDIGEDPFEDVPFSETSEALDDALRKFAPLHHEFRTNEEKWCKSVMAVTSSACSPQESAMALHAMNEQAERICREKGFKGMFAEDIDAATKVQYSTGI